MNLSNLNYLFCLNLSTQFMICLCVVKKTKENPDIDTMHLTIAQIHQEKWMPFSLYDTIQSSYKQKGDHMISRLPLIQENMVIYD